MGYVRAPLRLFDVAQAEKLIPFLERTFGEARVQLREIDALDRALKEAEGEPNAAGLSDRLRTEKAKLTANLLQSLKVVEDLGILVKAADGLVDFHAEREGRTVLLCWRYGEQVIGHWHELDTGFSGRTPILDRTEFSTAYLS